MMHHLNLQSSTSNISTPTSFFFPKVKVDSCRVLAGGMLACMVQARASKIELMVAEYCRDDLDSLAGLVMSHLRLRECVKRTHVETKLAWTFFFWGGGSTSCVPTHRSFLLLTQTSVSSTRLTTNCLLKCSFMHKRRQVYEWVRWMRWMRWGVAFTM